MSQKLVDELFHTDNEDEIIEIKEEKSDLKDKEPLNNNKASEDNLENKEETKESKKEKPLEKQEKSPDIDKYKADIAKLQKEISDNKRWGQEKNQSYILAKKRIDKLADDWIEHGLLDDESSKALRSIFSISDADDVSEVKSDEDNVYNLITEKLKKELPLYKKYVKDNSVDDNINAFFGGFGLLPEKEQKDLLEYLQDSDGADAIERVLGIGADLNDTIGSGVKKHGNIIAYVKSLNSENKKLQEKVHEYKKELDNQYGSVDTRGITTRAGNSNKKEDSTSGAGKALQELFGV